MVRLLSIISIILAIVLFPPAALALVSNNAVPGDATYPIKRSLEDVIYSVASVNSTSKAWFSAARSDRRYKEFSLLIKKGKFETNTLKELVLQTSSAAKQISEVKDKTQKTQLITQLSESIVKYDQGLEQIQKQTFVASVNPNPTALPTQEPLPQATQAPIPNTTQVPVARPTQTPMPVVTSVPTTQTPFPQNQNINNQQQDLTANQQKAVEDARVELELVKKQLEQENIKTQQGLSDQEPIPTAQPSSQPNNLANGTTSTGTIRKLTGVDSPTVLPSPVADCTTNCDLCTTMALPKCSLAKVYDTCEDNLGRKSTDENFCQGAEKFKCFSSVNNSCASVDPTDSTNTYIYSCSACTLMTPAPVSNQTPQPSTCQVNSACCSNPVQTCSMAGHDDSCPTGFQWCYSGYCVNDNYNSSTDSCS